MSSCLLALVALAHAASPVHRLADRSVLLEPAGTVVVTTSDRGVSVRSLADGAQVWSSKQRALWLDGEELLVVESVDGSELHLSVLEVGAGRVLRSCTHDLKRQSPPPSWGVSWRAFARPANGSAPGMLEILAEREMSARERAPTPAPGEVAIIVIEEIEESLLSFQLDPSTCTSSTRPIDPVPTPFPAFQWVARDAAGAEVRSVLLPAGYRTRVLASADGGTFASAYVDPGPERVVTWSFHDLATGASLGTLRPVDTGDAFVVGGRVALFETLSGGLVAYDLGTGAERWRIREP